MLRGGADQRLDQEQPSHHEQEPGAGALRGGEGDVPGERNDRVDCSRPCQPRMFQRPKAANRRPTPPSRAINEITLHTITFAVGLLSTSGSGGQLFVYE